MAKANIDSFFMPSFNLITVEYLILKFSTDSDTLKFLNCLIIFLYFYCVLV